MGKGIVPILFSLFMCVSILATMIIMHWKVGDGRLKIYDDEVRLSTKEVEDKGIKYDPEKRYYMSVRLRKTYTQKGSLWWKVDTDTVSSAVITKDR